MSNGVYKKLPRYHAVRIRMPALKYTDNSVMWLRIFSYYFLKRYSTLKISRVLYKVA